MKKDIHRIDGALWFRIEHAAKLAGTTAAKLRELTNAGTLDWTQALSGEIVVSEAAITAMRREKSMWVRKGQRQLAKREAAANDSFPSKR